MAPVRPSVEEEIAKKVLAALAPEMRDYVSVTLAPERGNPLKMGKPKPALTGSHVEKLLSEREDQNKRPPLAKDGLLQQQYSDAEAAFNARADLLIRSEIKPVVDARMEEFLKGKDSIEIIAKAFPELSIDANDIPKHVEAAKTVLRMKIENDLAYEIKNNHVDRTLYRRINETRDAEVMKEVARIKEAPEYKKLAEELKNAKTPAGTARVFETVNRLLGGKAPNISGVYTQGFELGGRFGAYDIGRPQEFGRMPPAFLPPLEPEKPSVLKRSADAVTSTLQSAWNTVRNTGSDIVNGTAGKMRDALEKRTFPHAKAVKDYLLEAEIDYLGSAAPLGRSQRVGELLKRELFKDAGKKPEDILPYGGARDYIDPGFIPPYIERSMKRRGNSHTEQMIEDKQRKMFEPNNPGGGRSGMADQPDWNKALATAANLGEVPLEQKTNALLPLKQAGRDGGTLIS